jgi:glucosamine--fructose-6-phosphate aminotransferase (isomerizing)
MPVIAVATQTALLEKMVSNIKEVITRGAKVLLVCKVEKEKMRDLTDYVLEIPPCNDFFAPLLAVIPLQLFAYYTAVLRGCDVDKPRNLAKSVTVE